MAPDGWDWLEPTEAVSTDDHEIGRSFARTFAGGDGGRVLAWLRAATIERRLPPDASEAHLRHLEGQRHLVAAIERMTAKGREGSGV